VVIHWVHHAGDGARGWPGAVLHRLLRRTILSPMKVSSAKVSPIEVSAPGVTSRSAVRDDAFRSRRPPARRPRTCGIAYAAASRSC